MPVRSTGCLTCRKRKIRCDEGRPGCERCATHGVPCPGYRADQPVGIEFKDQTTITAKRAEQRYRARSSGGGGGGGGFRPKDAEGSGNAVAASHALTVVQRAGSTPGSNADHDLFDRQMLLALADQQAGGSPARLLSPVAERAQIYQEFITSYFPKTRYGDQSDYFNFFQKIASRHASQEALEKGMDALSLVQLGSLNKDQRLLKEAGNRYGVALRSLANSIARGDYMHDDDVLAAVSTLAICELFEEIAGFSEGWAKHIQGSSVLFAARGPQNFNSELCMLLYTNVKHGSLIWALILRKTPFLAATEWRELAFKDPRAETDPEALFYDVSILVPAVLQKHDEINLDSSTAVADLDKVLEESVDLEARMRKWWGDWQDAATVDYMVDYQVRPIEDFQNFAALVPDRTFDHAYHFPDFQIAYMYSMYWMVMFELRRNIQSLQKMRHSILINWYPEPGDAVNEDELLGYVLSLCRCMPFFVEPISASAGHIGVFLPMRTAAFYFMDHGHWHWLKWIGAVRNGVFTKGLSPPAVPGRTSGIILRRQSESP